MFCCILLFYFRCSSALFHSQNSIFVVSAILIPPLVRLSRNLPHAFHRSLLLLLHLLLHHLHLFLSISRSHLLTRTDFSLALSWDSGTRVFSFRVMNFYRKCMINGRYRCCCCFCVFSKIDKEITNRDIVGVRCKWNVRCCVRLYTFPSIHEWRKNTVGRNTIDNKIEWSEKKMNNENSLFLFVWIFLSFFISMYFIYFLSLFLLCVV